MVGEYWDENRNYKFDFSEADKVFEVHEIAEEAGLNDVDFILELKDTVLFLEYKNAIARAVTNPQAFIDKILKPDKKAAFYKNIAKKFGDSLFILWSMRENEQDKEIKYVLLIEHPEIDGRIRKTLRNKIYKQLPFKLSKHKDVVRELISEFAVMNMEEWHEQYSMFPIQEIEEQI